MPSPTHISEILPSILIKAARKQAKRVGIPWPETKKKKLSEVKK